jgi:hypothetical protein
MSINIFPRALAVTLALGFTSTAMLSPAHALSGRAAAQACINRDDCHIDIWPGSSGAFTITLDGGGVIYCPSLNGECVVVSPDVGKIGQQPPVAAPINKTPVGAAPANPRGGNPPPVVNHPKPPRQINGLPVIYHPSPILRKPILTPIGKPSAPVILVRSGTSSGRGHGSSNGHGRRR